MSRIIDVPSPERIDRIPDTDYLILDSTITQDGVDIYKISLNHYLISTDEKLGPYSVITAVLDSSIGQIEILYDEGYRGSDALNETVTLLVQNLGLGGLITRSIVSLREHMA